VGAGDAYCVDLEPGPAGRPGQIIWVEHGGPSRLFVAGALRAWIAGRVGELAA
jgi:cell wall assembly regulator SMI1